jgi:hypothetical protein
MLRLMHLLVKIVKANIAFLSEPVVIITSKVDLNQKSTKCSEGFDSLSPTMGCRKTAIKFSE